MRASRPLLAALALAALLAAALPAAAGPVQVDASASASVDGAAGVQADGDGVTLEASEVGDLGDLEARAGTDAARLSTGGEGQAASGSGDILRGSPAEVQQAAGAASLVVLAAYAVSQLEAFAWLRRGAGLAVAPLYSRMDRSEILENETRREMYELVQDEAGISMQAIADEVGCGWGTVVYHLETLEDEDFVVSKRTGGRRRFFAAGDVDASDKEAVGVLRQDTPREIMAYLLRNPGSNQSELCEAVGCAASTASKHLGRLEEAGLVTREREWREVHYHPAEGVAERVPTAPDPADLDDGGPVATPA